MKHPIIDDPLCSCVQAIQDKYVSIRNEAMYQDEKSHPEKKWSEAGYTTDKYKNACMQYAPEYPTY
jgi:hypothetical protein